MKKMTWLFAWFAFAFLPFTLHAVEGGKTVNTILITRKDSVETVKASETIFTGDVSIASSVPRRGESRLTGGLVTFQPKARSSWHTHPYGQLLIIVEGRGRVQEWGGPVQEVASGDLVWFPAGIKHWHGATPAFHETLRHSGRTGRFRSRVDGKGHG